MVVIGITGNSGSGKTTVSTIIKNNLNCTVVSADNIAKKINIPESEYYKETIKLMGEEILKEDSTIDRRKLASILFTNSEIKKQMNEITARYVGNEIEKIINEEAEAKENNFIVIDAPLLYECGIDKLCTYVIAVTCLEKETKIRRICVRDRLTRNQAELRLNAQPDSDFYANKADYVIYNEATTNYLNLVIDVLKVVHKIKKSEKRKRFIDFQKSKYDKGKNV